MPEGTGIVIAMILGVAMLVVTGNIRLRGPVAAQVVDEALPTNVGDKLKVDTRTGAYLERAS